MQTMRKKITSLVISPVLIVILILSSFSFLGISIAAAAAAESKEYRHSVIGTLSIGNFPSKIAINPLNGFIYVSASYTYPLHMNLVYM